MSAIPERPPSALSDNRRACPLCAHDEWRDATCVCVDECNSEFCAGGLTVVQFVPVVEADDDW